MYISGGSNVYPREIEERLLLHSSIEEAAVIGVPDPKWGEVGVAVCVLPKGQSMTESELTEWLSNKLARYKIPKSVIFWASFPRWAIRAEYERNRSV